MNPIALALQSLISNLDPSNQKTPILGAIRKFNADTFGTPDYANSKLSADKRISDALSKYASSFISHADLGTPIRMGAIQKVGEITQHKPIEIVTFEKGNKIGSKIYDNSLDAQRAFERMALKPGQTAIPREVMPTMASPKHLMKYIDTQGYRTPTQIKQLKADVQKNGIQKAVELIKNSKGKTIVNDGTHRIQIANKLGIKEIPYIMLQN